MRTEKEIGIAIRRLQEARSNLKARKYFGFAIGNNLPDAIINIRNAIEIAEEEYAEELGLKR